VCNLYWSLVTSMISTTKKYEVETKTCSYFFRSPVNLPPPPREFAISPPRVFPHPQPLPHPGRPPPRVFQNGDSPSELPRRRLHIRAAAPPTHPSASPSSPRRLQNGASSSGGRPCRRSRPHRHAISFLQVRQPPSSLHPRSNRHRPPARHPSGATPPQVPLAPPPHRPPHVVGIFTVLRVPSTPASEASNPLNFVPVLDRAPTAVASDPAISCLYWIVPLNLVERIRRRPGKASFLYLFPYRCMSSPMRSRVGRLGTSFW
jgi:hypothetical protein